MVSGRQLQASLRSQRKIEKLVILSDAHNASLASRIDVRGNQCNNTDQRERETILQVQTRKSQLLSQISKKKSFILEGITTRSAIATPALPRAQPAGKC